MRRQTLGPMSGSTLNSRASLGRPSLGGRKASLGKQSTNIQLPVSALLWQCSRRDCPSDNSNNNVSRSSTSEAKELEEQVAALLRGPVRQAFGSLRR